MSGQVSEAEPGECSVSVVTRDGGEEVAAATTDGGYFEFTADRGEYDVVIGLPTETLVLERLRVG